MKYFPMETVLKCACANVPECYTFTFFFLLFFWFLFFGLTTTGTAAMRHKFGWNRLNRGPPARKALLKSMVIAMVKHERIVTTLAKAKELRRSTDKVTTHLPDF